MASYDELMLHLDDISGNSRTAKLWVNIVIKSVFIMMLYIRAEREATEASRVHKSSYILRTFLPIQYLHLMVMQGVSVSHEHLISFRMFSGARGTSSGRALGSKEFVLVSRMNPWFNGSISGGAECNACFHTQA